MQPELTTVIAAPGHSLRRDTIAIAVPQAIGLGAAFGLGLMLARWLGPTELGRYTLVLSWAAVIGALSIAGRDTLLVRELPVRCGRAQWGLLRGLLNWASLTVLATSVPAAIAGFIAARILDFDAGTAALLAGAALIPVTALLRLHQSGLRGLRRLAESQTFELLVQPVIAIALLLILIRIDAPANATAALLIWLAAGLIALLGATRATRRALPGQAVAAVPVYDRVAWRAATRRLLLLAMILAANSRLDVLVLGALDGSASVGVYAIALRGAALIPLPMSMAILAMAPAFAQLHEAGRRGELQALVLRMRKWILMAGVPLAGAMIIGRVEFLGLFGPAFQTGSTALVVLSLGQLVNIAAGPVATLLTMTGYERDTIRALALSTAVNALLCVMLIPRWGLNGAAFASAVSLALWNVILLWLARRRLGIPLGLAN